YIGHSGGRWGMDAGAGAARARLDVQRRLAFVAFAPRGQPLFGGGDSVATRRQSALPLDLWGQGRFNSGIGLWRTITTAGIRTERLRMNGWREDGADALSLTAGSQIHRLTQADARLQITRQVGRA